MAQPAIQEAQAERGELPRLVASLGRNWCSSIREDFKAGRIVTEADLQGCLYHYLRLLLPDAQIYLTPRICDVGKAMLPDMCIIAKNEALLVELKVQHRTRQGVVWENDVTKLAKLAAMPRLSLESRGMSKIREVPPYRSVAFALISDSTCDAADFGWFAENAKKLADDSKVKLPERFYWLGGVWTDEKLTEPTFIGPYSVA